MARRNDSLSESLNCARPTEVAVQQCTAGGARSGSQGRPAELGRRVRQLDPSLQSKRFTLRDFAPR